MDILKSFCSCSLVEISKFHLYGNKANAHANAFITLPLAVCFGVLRQTAFCGFVARLGRGSFAFIVQGNAEPRLGKCNDLRPFLYPYEFGMSHCRQGRTPEV